MYGYIYKTTNLINSMIYIGQHKSAIFSKKYFGSGKLISRALKLYGKNNFKVEMLEMCESASELDEKEKFWIADYKLPDFSIGYNITKGGQLRFFTGMHHTEESKKLISEKTKGKVSLPTTANYIWLTDGNIEMFIARDQLTLEIINLGFIPGRKYREAWNSNLSKETNKTLQQISDTRKEKIKTGEIKCCYGLKGSDSPNYIQNGELLSRINRDEFINYWRENGHYATCRKYHMRKSTFDRLFKLFGLVETKEHKSYIYRKNKNKS